MCACEHERFDVVTYLVGKGAKVNIANIFGTTALHYAYSSGNDKLIHFLKEKGANSEVM
jgi:ankyrin repeat protein